MRKVRKTIQAKTDEVAGSNKGIVDDPIILSIYSPDAPDLSIIDLPGITKVPLRGTDQKRDIEKITKEVIVSIILITILLILSVMITALFL